MHSYNHDPLTVVQFELSSWDNLAYLVYDASMKEGVIIDAPSGLTEILEYSNSQKLTITNILLTHTHFDHTKGLEELLRINSKLTVAVHSQGVAKLPEKTSVHVFQDGERITIGSSFVEVMFTPGHIPDAVCLFNDQCIFTGDTVFINSHGRTDLEGGDAATLKESFAKLRTLPDSLALYPGHSYNGLISTLAAEKNNL